MRSSLFLLALAMAATAACSSARRGETVARPRKTSDPALERGEIVFMRSCHKCHPGGEAGLGPALNDKPLPTFLKAFQIRQGLGAMPSFPEEELGEQELEDLLAYLAELRHL